MQQTHATSDSEEGSETEPEEDTFSMPEPEQVIKLSAQVRGASGMLWKGRVRGGGNDIFLERSWVRNNFGRSFRKSVEAAGGRYVYIPTGRAQERAAPADLVAIGMDRGFSFCSIPVLSAPGASDNSSGAILTAECPVVAYRQGAADLCAAYGLASAMHHYGDASGGTAIAACARAALASDDAFGHVTAAVRIDAAGWSSEPITDHDPLATIIETPVNMQIVGSDGAGTHAVATLGGYIFDAAEARALPFTRAALDRCVGAQLNGARFSHVARAVRLVPGKSLRKRRRRDVWVQSTEGIA